jgi:hypothetical protein
MPDEGDADPKSPSSDRSVHRDQGEVQQWPRGLVGYVVSGPPDAGPPPEEEERTAQRIRLAGRLIDLLRAHGEDDPTWLTRLREAERAYRAGDRARASRIVDELLGDLGERAERARLGDPPHRQP